MTQKMTFRISKDLPQFAGEQDLFIVAGTQEAEFYLASNGTIRKIAAVEIRRLRYADRAGFFVQRGARRSHGAALRSGAAVDHAQKEKIASEFRRQFQSRVAATARNEAIDHVYVFAPAHVMAGVKALFPKTLNRRVIFSGIGNFCGQHPFRLLERVGSVVERRKAAVGAPIRKG